MMATRANEWEVVSSNDDLMDAGTASVLSADAEDEMTKPTTAQNGVSETSSDVDDAQTNMTEEELALTNSECTDLLQDEGLRFSGRVTQHVGISTGRGRVYHAKLYETKYAPRCFSPSRSRRKQETPGQRNIRIAKRTGRDAKEVGDVDSSTYVTVTFGKVGCSSVNGIY